MQIKEKIKKINYKSENFNVFTLKSGTRVKYQKKLDCDIDVDTLIKVDGEFVNDPKYGRTFVADIIEIGEVKEPDLLSIAIDGIGSKKNEEIIADCGSYKVFFDNPFKIFDYFLSTPSKNILEQIRNKRFMFSGDDKEKCAKQIAKKIKGVGTKKLLSWMDDFEKWHKFNVQSFLEDINIIKYLASDSALEIYVQILKLKELEQVYLTLFNWKINVYTIKQIFKDYTKLDILKEINDNPYLLLDYNIPFPIVDNIAIQEFNKDLSENIRIISGIKHVIKSHEAEGGTFIYFKETIEEILSILKIDEMTMQKALNIELLKGQESEFVLEDNKLYRRVIYFTEKKIGRMLFDKTVEKEINIPSYINDYLKTTHLSHEQQNAVLGVLSKKISILTGGPGTGKTTTINEVCNCLDKMHKKYFLCAPTGRASKRMQESTGRNAQTIHRLLEYKVFGNTGHFAKNEKYQLFADYIIVDESSMVDIYLLNSLLKATSKYTSLIFVGDIDQLPSVSMGSILIDMKDSGKIPIYTLTEIFRQSSESTIVRNAYHIKNNEPLETGTDFKFIKVNNFNEVKDFLMKNSLEQILCPMRVGEIGTKKINELVQELYSKNTAKSCYYNGTVFKENDKVIQVSNDYEKNVYNGEIGIITEINNEGVNVFFKDNTPSEIKYRFDELYKIELAYAVTIHKSQGSETDNLYIIIDGNEEFLSKELIYTAVTRAKKNIVMLSTKDLSFYSNLKTSAKRLTNLANLIK